VLVLSSDKPFGVSLEFGFILRSGKVLVCEQNAMRKMIGYIITSMSFELRNDETPFPYISMTRTCVNSDSVEKDNGLASYRDPSLNICDVQEKHHNDRPPFSPPPRSG
jgi:hypothetical protein